MKFKGTWKNSKKLGKTTVVTWTKKGINDF